MVSFWNKLRFFFCIYFIFSIQYSFYGASPLIGPSVEVDSHRRLPFIVSITNKTRLYMYRTGEYLASENAHFCGGSLITIYHVLTAAHCLWWYTFCQYYNITLPVKYYDDRKEIIYDIAIMKLETPTISYIPNELLYGKLAVIGGWGKIEENVQPRYMRIARFFILDPIKCNHIIKDKILEEARPPLFLCSSISRARTSKGDSGSPLLYDGVNFDYPNNIVGVNRVNRYPTGEGASCQFINSHVSINAYRPFIEKLTRS